MIRVEIAIPERFVQRPDKVVVPQLVPQVVEEHRVLLVRHTQVQHHQPHLSLERLEVLIQGATLPAEFAQRIRNDISRWSEVAKAANVSF